MEYVESVGLVNRHLAGTRLQQPMKKMPNLFLATVGTFQQEAPEPLS